MGESIGLLPGSSPMARRPRRRRSRGYVVNRYRPILKQRAQPAEVSLCHQSSVSSVPIGSESTGPIPCGAGVRSTGLGRTESLIRVGPSWGCLGYSDRVSSPKTWPWRSTAGSSNFGPPNQHPPSPVGCDSGCQRKGWPEGDSTRLRATRLGGSSRRSLATAEGRLVFLLGRDGSVSRMGCAHLTDRHLGSLGRPAGVRLVTVAGRHRGHSSPMP